MSIYEYRKIQALYLILCSGKGNGRVLTTDISLEALNAHGELVIEKYPEVAVKIDFRLGADLDVLGVTNGSASRTDREQKWMAIPCGTCSGCLVALSLQW